MLLSHKNVQAVDAVDPRLQDILKVDKSIGGKILVFDGDFSGDFR